MRFTSFSQQRLNLLSFFQEREETLENRPRIIISPYRVCPLGAHIDHQGGAVLGMTLDAGSILAFEPSEGSWVRLHSTNYDSVVEFDLKHLGSAKSTGWGRYAIGAATVLNDHAPLTRGIVGAVSGTLPEGGLSSSASVGLAYLSALAEVNGIELGPMDLVELDRRLENNYLGLRNGILDPASIVHGKERELLHIDTQRPAVEAIAMPAHAPSFQILVVQSGVPRNLTKGSGYNNRVAECREAACALATAGGLPDTAILGKIPLEVFDEFGARLPRAPRLRARHFFSEVERVSQGLVAWKEADWDRFGELMNQSCDSSLRNYECGCPELEGLQEIMRRSSGVLGSRFSGAGFGGCHVGFVEEDFSVDDAAAIQGAYVAAFPHVRGRAAVYLGSTGEGVRSA